MEGRLKFDENYNLIIEQKVAHTKNTTKGNNSCPKCNIGNIVKGKNAYGCSNFKNGCNFKVDFETIRQKSIGKKITEALVYSILNEHK